MRTLLLATLRLQARRYVSAAVAIVIGVAFVVATGALTSSARAGLLAEVGVPYAGATTVASNLTTAQADRLVAAVRRDGGSTGVVGSSYQTVVTGDGRRLDPGTTVGVVADAPALRWQHLTSGGYPTGPGQALVDRTTARSAAIEVGDTLTIGSANDPLRVRVVGIVSTPAASSGAAIYVPWADARAWGRSFRVESVATTASVAQTRRALPGRSVSVTDAETYVRAEAAALSAGVDVIGYLVLFFVAIALFVAVLVIGNTFAILFAQRQRDLALLRCVGATRGQIRTSVRGEALVLGVVASAVGLVVGEISGRVLVALIGAVSDSASLGPVSVSSRWLVAGFAVGVLVTVGSAWAPTRTVVSVSPLAALRPQEEFDAGSQDGRRRLRAGAGLGVAGVLLLVLATVAHEALLVVLGGAVSFAGVLLLGPALMPALIRLAGRPLGAVWGSAGRLATANAVRNPRRTATTTASLLVGVTITTAVLTGLASARGSLSTDLDRLYPVDLSVVSTQPLDDSTVAAIGRVDGVAASVALDGVVARVGAAPDPVTVVTAPSTEGVVRGRLPVAGRHEALVPSDFPSDTRFVSLRTDAGSVRLRTRVVEGLGDAVLVAPATLRTLTDRPQPLAVWVRAAGGVDPADLTGDVTALIDGSHTQVAGGLSARRYADRQVAMLTGAVAGLLAIAVVIALVGIANTLGLSVLERGREHALLRALGLSRRHLAATLGMEAVLLSTVATLLGTGLGVFYAWVGITAVISPTVPTPLVLPIGQLAAIVAITGTAGLAACIAPSRRAARVAPAAGLATL